MSDIIDAEFEMVDAKRAGTKSASQAKPEPEESSTTPAGQAGSKAQLGVFDSKTDDRNTSSRRPMGLWQFTLIGSVACAGAFLVSGGYVLLGDAIIAGTPANVSTPTVSGATGPGTMDAVVHDGLVLWDVHFERKLSNGREYLSVEAMVRNDSEQMKSIPALRLLFGPPDAKARYRIERGENLEPGEQLVFTSRIRLRDTDPVNPVLEFIR